MSIRPATKSQTVQFSVLTFFASILALASKPDFYSKLGKVATIYEKPGIAKILNDFVPVVTALGSLGAVAGRFRVGDLYTPKFLPGPNKVELEIKMDKEGERDRLLKEVHEQLSGTNPVLAEVRQVVTSLANPPDKTELPVDLVALAKEVDS